MPPPIGLPGPLGLRRALPQPRPLRQRRFLRQRRVLQQSCALGHRWSPGLCREAAYLMPVAAGTAGLLMLLGLSLQGLALQERVQVGAMERLRREEDLLASAAHQVLAALNGPHSCLLTLPLARWEAEGAVCATPQALATLRRQEVWEVPVRLLAWQPGADGWSAEMELQLEAGAGRTARRGRFGTRLAGAPPQALDPRARQLAGALP